MIMEYSMRLQRKRGFYEKYIKRLLDFICSLLAIVLFGWLYIIIAIVVKIKMGSPVFFKQPRPGMVDPKTGKERIFDMLKFRTMTDERDANGELLPDVQRLPKFGKLLRATSLDELPEVFNILKGDMSIIGPRPQLVRDMVFMSDEQRMRHTAMPGMSGLAQTNGRNAITWDDKIKWDLKYIEEVTFIGDVKLVIKTAMQVFIRRKNETNDAETDLNLDYGDALLMEGRVSKEKYDELQEEAKKLLAKHERK
ncbi:MAG: sugar transferase [Oscillospiraceae bacterium]|nr:sugar transferase [Oscillospiraceae bacterium]